MATIDVLAGADLQDAINLAQPGDTLRLEAGATWSSDYLLPVKSGNGQITITTSNMESLPLAGNRVTEEQSRAYPKIVGHIKTMPKSSNYVLRGLRVEAYPNYYTGGLVNLGGEGINNDIVIREEENLPRNWAVDRCWIQADPNWGGKRGIAANCANLTVTDSVMLHFFSDAQDTQAIGCWNGPGPYRIENCHLEASGENIMFGGACPAIPNLVPSDITVKHCWLRKPDDWRVTGLMAADTHGARPAVRLRALRKRPGQFASYTPVVKNLFELKNASRVSVQDCIMEGCWSSGQAGFAVQLTVRTCEAGDYAWATVSDVAIENCLIVSENGINILGSDGNRSNCGEPPIAGSAYNIVLRNLEVRASWCFQILSGANNILIERNSCDQNWGAMMCFDSVPELGKMENLKTVNNRFTYGSGIIGTNAGPGMHALNAYWEPWMFESNAIYKIPSSEMWWIADPSLGWYPADNLYTDSQEPPPGYGCDTAALEQALKHVRDGQAAGNPEPPPVIVGTLHLDEVTQPGDYPVYAAGV